MRDGSQLLLFSIATGAFLLLALDEGGTMHEGLADFYAAAITGDSLTAEWVGAKMPAAPNGDGAARELANSAKCPDDFIGEVHHDSLPFSAAPVCAY